VATAIIGSVSSQFVFYSTYARGYIFVLLGVSVSLAGLLLLTRRDAAAARRSAGFALYGTGAALAIYSHTTMFLWPIAASAALAALMIADKDARSLLRGWLVANAVLIGVTGWWIYIVARQIGTGAATAAWIEPVDGRDYVSILRRTVLFVRTNTGIYKWATYLIFGFACLALVRRNRPLALVAGLLLASIAVFWVAQLVQPIILPRTVFWMSGLLVLIVSAGIANLQSRIARHASLGAISVFLIAELLVAKPGFKTHDWTAFLKFASQHPGYPYVLASKAGAIAATQACEAEFGQPCPVRLVVVHDARTAPAWSDEYRGPVLTWSPGKPLPPMGMVYIFATQDPGVPVGRHDFGTLRLYGPAPLAQMALAFSDP